MRETVVNNEGKDYICWVCRKWKIDMWCKFKRWKLKKRKLGERKTLVDLLVTLKFSDWYYPTKVNTSSNHFLIDQKKKVVPPWTRRTISRNHRFRKSEKKEEKKTKTKIKGKKPKLTSTSEEVEVEEEEAWWWWWWCRR